MLGRLMKANGELILEQQAEHSTASYYALPEVHRYRERDIGALIEAPVLWRSACL